ncbi:TPA: transporter substrate-binding domain-containing protein [Aeromonas sobria]|nr:transporter substrate-binding domain-containing protein [Aeromonas sobria]HEH9433534.1 transporter substrate-binding domain-containing protein [Aeromonas sobria]
MRFTTAMLCVLIIQLHVVYAATPANLRLETSLAPPYQTVEDGNLKGYAVNTVKCVLDKIGVQYQFKIVPPKRAELDLVMGRSSGFFSSIDQPNLNKYAKLSAPIVLDKWYWFSLASISRETHNALIKNKIGVLRGSSQETWLLRNNIPIYQSVNNSDSLLKLLQRQRIDLFLADDSVVRELNKTGINLPLHKRFEKYAPMGMYISNHVLLEHPSMIDKFNSKISECNQSNLFLSATEQEVIEVAVNKIYLSTLGSQELINVLKLANLKNKHIKIEAVLQRDLLWRSMVENNLFVPNWITNILNSTISRSLKDLTIQYPYITEIMLTDERGVLTAASNLTSDYWQGDEEKIIETLKMANENRRINSLGRFDQSNNRLKMPSIEYDASSKLFLCRLNYPVWYKGQLIGVLSFGINVENALIML